VDDASQIVDMGEGMLVVVAKGSPQRLTGG